MPTKKSTSKSKSTSVKKTAVKTKKKAVPKKAAKKMQAKSRKASSKNRSAVKSRSKSVKSKNETKKTEVKKIPDKKGEELFILSMDDRKREANKTTKGLPVINLEELTAEKATPVALMKESEKHLVTVGSRVSFYIGIFFGALVVNVFILSLLAIFSV